MQKSNPSLVPCANCGSDNQLVLTHGLSREEWRGYTKCRDCGGAVVEDREEIEAAVKKYNQMERGKA